MFCRRDDDCSIDTFITTAAPFHPSLASASIGKLAASWCRSPAAPSADSFLGKSLEITTWTLPRGWRPRQCCPRAPASVQEHNAAVALALQGLNCNPFSSIARKTQPPTYLYFLCADPYWDRACLSEKGRAGKWCIFCARERQAREGRGWSRRCDEKARGCERVEREEISSHSGRESESDKEGAVRG